MALSLVVTSVYFRRHDETDQHFVFEHEAMAALSINRFPFEHWQRQHITHSSIPYANPHAIDPICLTGVDFQAVLVTVKAETITDIPMHLAVKNYCSVGTISEVTIIDFEDLASGSAPSSGSDPESIPAAASSVDDEEFVEFGGGAGYADAMEMLGVPPPLVPHGEPFGAAPAASLVARALANAPPLPSVHGCPVLSKPKSVQVQLRLGFFDVTVSGSRGERLSFRLPLRKAASDMGSKGLMVANFVTASVGLLDSVALLGPLRRPVISVDILARSIDAGSGTSVPLAVADALVNGTLAEALPLTGAAMAESGDPLPGHLPAEEAPSATTTLGLGGQAGATLEAPLPSAPPVRSPPVLLLAGEVSPVAGTV
jgi:hypothetical protein